MFLFTISKESDLEDRLHEAPASVCTTASGDTMAQLLLEDEQVEIKGKD